MNENIIAFDRSNSRAPNNAPILEESLLSPDTKTSFYEILHESSPSAASIIEISVVVPTYGRPELLKQCLNNLLYQEFDSASYEVIIVDDGPHAATRAAVVECAAQLEEGKGPRILYIASPGPHGPAAARNHGWHAAQGKMIAFTDDDTIPSPGWLRNGLNAFGPDIKAVWGTIHMPLEDTPTDYERDAKGLEVAEFVTANCFCPRAVLDELGGFDERFRFAWREDADLYFRLLGLGGQVVHAPDALITHPIRPASWGISMRQQKKVLFDALLYKKHPALYRQKIRAKPRWDYYIIVLSLVAFPFSLLSGQAVIAVASGILWLWLTLRFCIMRLKGTAKTPSHIAEMIVTSAVIPPLAVFWRLVGALKFRVALI